MLGTCVFSIFSFFPSLKQAQVYFSVLPGEVIQAVA